METKRFTKTEIFKAAKLLQKGELIAFPTETVYGLGANALMAEAIKKVFAVKGRPSDNPLIVHVESFEQVKKYVSAIHPMTQQLVNAFWPGPLTLIFKTKANAFPKEVSAGLDTVSFRMPNHEATLALIQTAGVPLVGPSANTSGKPSPTTSEHVYHDLKGKIAGILEGGPTSIGVESTVLDLSDPLQPPMILRPGAVTKEQLEKELGIEVLVDKHLLKESEAPRSPGMKYKHYAPNTKVLMIHSDDWQKAVAWGNNHQLRIGVLSGPAIAEEVRASTAAVFMYANDSVQSATKGLFAGLRALDDPKLQLDIIFVQTFPEVGLGTAYMNRLKKSAGQKFFEK